MMEQLIDKIPELLLGAIIGAILTIPLAILLNDFFLDILDRLQGYTQDSPRTQFRGRWLAHYNRLDQRESGQGDTQLEEPIQLKQRGNRVVGIHLLKRRVRLKGQIQERYWTGTWHDIGLRRSYHGAFQLVMNPSGDTMTGRWIGFSSREPLYVKYGDWKFRRAD
jgi:hypothetical protein